ncbi:purine-cytosine permease family protein [Streptomyces lavendulae]|uniref:purine-cytosine permease family protein n=1 Tax=Streptomyces lavendulae TaxID=1914 RepID=UPI0024A5A8DC|nr:allantoin permease [Streptomyces roseochromogenus]
MTDTALTSTPPKEPRRSYARLAADESREDYSLRYAPHTFRRWSPGSVAGTALGGIAYLADFAIGASIVFAYGFTSGAAAILAAAVVIFLTGIPIARACATYGLDMDLVTRGAGFGYFGSTLTSLIYASFTFIFFALEGSIMAQAMHQAFGLPVQLGYLLTTLIVIPVVFRGMGALAKVQAWTQPVWLVGLALPFLVLAFEAPGAWGDFTRFGGTDGAGSGFSWIGFGFGTGIALSLIAQIGEQADYLRFMPAETPANRRRRRLAVLAAGPGWVVIGAAKQLGGAFLAFAALEAVGKTHALEPIAPQVEALRPWLGGLALPAAALFVIVSQIKINVTNAYSGSLSWSNFFSRVTHRHPGRVWYIFLNLAIALTLMELDMFAMLGRLLGFYSNVGIAWIAAVAADLVINKRLGLSPPYIEFKRAYLYAVNPAGFGAMVIASTVSILAFSGLFGTYAEAFSTFIAAGLALLLCPLIAWATGGKYYLARPNTVSGPDAEVADVTATHTCAVCETAYELPDIADCPAWSGPVCSLCCSLDATCGDVCRKTPGAGPVALPTPSVRPV